MPYILWFTAGLMPLVHFQNWYSRWGWRSHFKVAAGSFPSCDTIRGGCSFRIRCPFYCSSLPTIDRSQILGSTLYLIRMYIVKLGEWLPQPVQDCKPIPLPLWLSIKPTKFSFQPYTDNFQHSPYWSRSRNMSALLKWSVSQRNAEH